MDLDINKLPPELQMKLAAIMDAVEEREPEGEVSYERLSKLNSDVFDIRKRLLAAQYDGAVQATDNLIKHMERDEDVKNRQHMLKMAIVSLEVTIDDSKRELVEALLKAKFEARKTVKRGSKNDRDMDMIDTILSAAETEAGYDPAAAYQKTEEAIAKPKRSSTGFGFGANN
jgi:galactokinase/mevalonate kinase-like predicted kinase